MRLSEFNKLLALFRISLDLLYRFGELSARRGHRALFQVIILAQLAELRLDCRAALVLFAISRKNRGYICPQPTLLSHQGLQTSATRF